MNPCFAHIEGHTGQHNHALVTEHCIGQANLFCYLRPFYLLLGRQLGTSECVHALTLVHDCVRLRCQEC